MRPIAPLLLCLLPWAAWGGPGLDWRWSNPQPSGDDLIRVDFFDSARGLIVADNGAVSATDDGGSTWKDRGGRIANDYLIAAAAVDARTVISLSNNGRIWRTGDGGLTWKVAAAYQAMLMAVESCGDGLALAAGTDGTIVRSGDGGATWSQVRGDTSGTYLLGVHCAGKRAVVVGEAGTVLLSVDGGLHWETLPAPIPEYLTGVAFSDPSHGFVTSEQGRIAETRDGGRTWAMRALDTMAYLGGIRVSGSDWRITGNDGGVWISRNDGADWTRAPSLARALVWSSGFAGAKGYVAVGESGLILREKGRNGPWEIVRKGPTRFVDGVARVSPDSWLAYGSPGLMLRSSDNGATWRETGIQPDSVRFLSGAFNGRTGLLAGDDGTLLRSEDGGETWSQPATPRKGLRLFGVAWGGPADAAAVGDSGAVWHSGDAGRTWSKAAVPPGADSATYSAVAFLPSGTGFAVAYGGVILRTGDRGATWARVDSPTEENLYGLAFRDERTGIAVGGHGAILLTGDGGSTWTLGSMGPGVDFTCSLAWLGGDTAVAIGSPGHGWFMRLSTDAGANWTPLPIPTRKELWYVSALGPGRAILTGDGGTILLGTLHAGESGGPGPSIPSASDGQFTVQRTASAAGIRFHVDLASERALTLRAYSFAGRGLGTVYQGRMGAGSHTLVLPYALRGPAVFRLEAAGPEGRIRRSRVLPH